MDRNFNLIPEPRVCLTTGKPGFDATAWQGKPSLAIAQALEHATGIAIEYVGLDAYCAQFDAGLPAGFHREQGYLLALTATGAVVGANTETGRFYARQTLAQLLAEGQPLPEVRVIDWPQLNVRCFHFCYHVVTEYLPMLSVNMPTAIELVREYAHLKMNAVLVEFEGFFPYRKYPQLRNKQCFTEEEMERFRQVCRECHVTVIPLLQSLGHVYYILRHREFAHLRELPDTTQQFCPMNPASRDLVMELAQEMIDFFGDIPWFHLGGDESRRLGLCPDCSKKVRDEGMGALYADHINDLARRLKARGVRAMVWGDIMEDYPGILDTLDRSIGVIYWNYDMVDWNRPYVIEQYVNRGFTVLGGGAARFSTHSDYFFLYRKSMRNTALLAEECVRHGFEGYISTDWTKLTPAEPAIVGNVNAAQCSWGGALPQVELAARFSRLYFGVRTEAMDRVFTDLAETVMRRKDLLNGYWAPPYCHINVDTLVDFLDRYDWSGGNFKRLVQQYTGQDESPKAVKLMKEAIDRAQDALKLLGEMEPSVTAHRRLYDILVLAAREQLVKCRMGLAYDAAVKALKYPKLDDGDVRARLAQELRQVERDWNDVERRTWDAVLPGTHQGSLEQAMALKFDPDARRFLRGFAEMLEHGGDLQGLLNLKEYE